MYGVVLHAHPVRGESHNQRNTTGEVATIQTRFSEKSMRDKSAAPLHNVTSNVRGQSALTQLQAGCTVTRPVCSLKQTKARIAQVYP